MGVGRAEADWSGLKTIAGGDSFFKKLNFDGQQNKGAVAEKGVIKGFFIF